MANDIGLERAVMARTRSTRTRASRRQCGDERTLSSIVLATHVDPNRSFPSALAKLQNKASVLHRSFGRKMLRFFKALDLERDC
jgi:hypothetical protein